MTNQKAIEIINKEVWHVFPEYREALDMAINALSTIETIKERSYLEGFHEANKLYHKAVEEIKADIENIYPEHQSTGELTGYADAIDDILKIIDNHISEYKEMTKPLDRDVKQEPKTEQGKWIEERTYMECPHCHDIWHYEENQTERFKYCPTCGERNEYESKYTRNGI